MTTLSPTISSDVNGLTRGFIQLMYAVHSELCFSMSPWPSDESQQYRLTDRVMPFFYELVAFFQHRRGYHTETVSARYPSFLPSATEVCLVFETRAVNSDDMDYVKELLANELVRPALWYNTALPALCQNWSKASASPMFRGSRVLFADSCEDWLQYQKQATAPIGTVSVFYAFLLAVVVGCAVTEILKGDTHLKRVRRTA